MDKPLYRNLNLYFIFAITMVGIAGVSLLAPVLPAIGKRFQLPPAEVGLVLTMYTLPGVALMLFFGILADKWGRKALLVPSLILFGVAGGSLFWVQDFFWMNVLRFLQGVGGAALPSMATVLIGDLFEEDVRLKVMGLNAAVLSVGTSIFPVLGGALAAKGWNFPFLLFWFALPLAGLVYFYFQEPEKNERKHIPDYFKSARGYIFTNRSMSAFFLGFVVFIFLYGGLLTYLTLYMDHRFGMSPFTIGIFVASGSLTSAVASLLAFRIERWIGRRRMLVGGFLLFALAFATVPAVSSQKWLVAAFLLFGAAMGITVPLLQSIVTAIAPVEYRGLLVSFFGMMIRLGQTLGPPLLALCLLFGGLELVFAACAVTGLILSFFLCFRVWIFREQ